MRYSDPFEEVLEEIQDTWGGEDDAFGRVCSTLFDTEEYTHRSEISELADCALATGTKHLNRLVELGVAQKYPSDSYASYRRNPLYIEWRVLRHIIDEYPMDEIIERVEALEARQDVLVGNDGVIPSIVPAADVKLNESVGSQMEAADELELIKRRIRLYELVRQARQNDGHLVSREF